MKEVVTKMRTRKRNGRWQSAAGMALAVALSCSLAGSTSVAFAEDEEMPGAETPEEDVTAAPEDGRDELAGSAFKLGDVKLSVKAVDEDAPELAMGVPVERTYIVTNEGERAYVRLASMLTFGDLVRTNDLGVTDTAIVEPDESAEDKTEPAVASPWCLADDGWWYRGAPLEPGERIVVHVLIEIPKNDVWREALITGEPSNIEEVVHVDAVQARNMSIDVDDERPWGDLKVEAAPAPEPTPGAPEPTEPEGEDGDDGDENEEGEGGEDA